MRPGREGVGVGGEYPLFLLRPSLELPASASQREARGRGSPAVAASWGTETDGESLKAGLGNKQRTSQHTLAEDISSYKKQGNNFCPAYLQGGCEDQAGGSSSRGEGCGDFGSPFQLSEPRILSR